MKKAIKLYSRGYIGAVFKATQDLSCVWHGVAQMFLANPLRNPPEGFRAKPLDSFQERVEPYFGWATCEYVLESGTDNLPGRPLALSVPFSTLRSGFFKVISFLPAKADRDHGCDTLSQRISLRSGFESRAQNGSL